MRLSFAIIRTTLLRDARNLAMARATTVGKSVLSRQPERGHPQGEHSTWSGRNGEMEGKEAVGGLGERQLCRPPDVAMVQATDFADRHDLPSLRRLDRSRSRRR
jgi:hypothetical protein